MLQTFAYADVGVVQLNILAHQGNGHHWFFAFGLRNQTFPASPVGRLGLFEVQPFHQEIGHFGLFK
ncbi:hypothetical protein SDC9_179617 [bioreactor metagenome]|uniref:Uncharacterized protein n=1 Tax=bioreactor metagenome TaxID=1076179 RepID=A0A645GZA2_9ZZZZ